MKHRVSLSLEPDVLDMLRLEADRRGLRPTSLAASFVRTALALPSSPQAATPGNAPTSTPDERAAWLELDRGEPWRRSAWEAVEQLRREYPDLADALPEDWTSDRVARDGVLALAVWRIQLDGGRVVDPRTEHQWLAALRDFKTLLASRAGHVGAPAEPQPRPRQW